MLGTHIAMNAALLSWETRLIQLEVEAEISRIQLAIQRRQMEIMRDIEDYRLGRLIDLPADAVRVVPEIKLLEGM